MAKYRFTSRQYSAEISNGRTLIYFDEEEGVERTTVTREDGVEESTSYLVYDYRIATIESPATKWDIVNAIIRSRYTQSDVEALMRHKLNGDEGADAEFDEFNDFAERAKARAVEILNARIEAE